MKALLMMTMHAISVKTRGRKKEKTARDHGLGKGKKEEGEVGRLQRLR